MAEEERAEAGEAAQRDSDLERAKREHQLLKEEQEGEVGLNVMA